MPLFIKARTGQKRIVFVTSTKYSAVCEHASASRICSEPKLKIKGIASAPKERIAKRKRHDKMAPLSKLGTPESSMNDIHGNTKHHESSQAELLTYFCPIRDNLQTPTSTLQDETMKQCLPLLTSFEESPRDLAGLNTWSMPRLRREKHVGFLHQCLKPLAAGFVGFDASRPWILYWVLAGLSLLGEDVQSYRER